MNAGGPYLMADLYTITLATGAVYRWSAADTDIVLDGNTFSGVGPLLKRGKTRVVAGLAVDTLDVTILRGDSTQFLGIPITMAAANGALDRARVLLQRVVMPTWGDTSLGATILFEGAVAGVDPSSTEIRVTVKSDLELLNIAMPHTVYQPQCSHALYDAGCGIDRASFTFVGSATGTPTTTVIASAMGQSAEYFKLGVLTMTSGVAAGSKRAVKSFSGGTFTLAMPLPASPAAGDTFTASPGCDKKRSTCESFWLNLIHFRGFPYIPTPETGR